MKIITKQSLIDGVAAAWKRQYCISYKWTGYNGDAAEKYRLLNELPNGATEDDVSSIIGNKSWTFLKCEECGNDADVVIEVGEPRNYESHTARLCVDCIKKIYAAFVEVEN